MDYTSFNEVMQSVKLIEDTGYYEKAQQEYQKLFQQDLDRDQYAIVIIGSATCYLRAMDALSARNVLAHFHIGDLDPTVQAVICNLRSDSYHELGDYKQAIREGQAAEEIARTLGVNGLDILGEALGRQGFAEAELGRLHEASKHLTEAKTMPVDDFVLRAISMYEQQFHLRHV